jgi:hypothetical protein
MIFMAINLSRRFWELRKKRIKRKMEQGMPQGKPIALDTLSPAMS